MTRAAYCCRSAWRVSLEGWVDSHWGGAPLETLLAYLLNLGEVVPADFVLSDKTMAQAQAF